MCGRFTITVSYEELVHHLKDYYEIDDVSLFDVPRYNVAPGQEVISILNDGSKNRVGLLKWGFIPPYAKDEKIGFSLINAQAETIFSKPTFMDSAMSKRCVVIADSFYEWQKDDTEKKPMLIFLRDQKLFSFAGLWTTYKKSDGSKINTVTIITTTPNELMTNIHHRMPVILSKEDEKIWLNPRIKNQDVLQHLLKPYPSAHMDYYRVSSVVNNTRNESIECIKKLDEKKEQDLFD
ncbi:MAG: SOS response-associated peptidase [Acholeplasmataceae bacterium]|jgi:putative SOS response-associated peptidase YedK|nr:SOS response-associated peptidase [Acholeplasmataceae bacterium]